MDWVFHPGRFMQKKPEISAGPDEPFSISLIFVVSFEENVHSKGLGYFAR